MDSLILFFFIIVVFPLEILKFWSVHGFVIFDHTQLLSHVLANIQYFAPWALLKNHENLNFCSTSLLKHTFSICKNLSASKLSSKPCLLSKSKIIKKQQGFSSKLMTQGLKIHLPKSQNHHSCINQV